MADDIFSETGGRVMYAADFAGHPACPLEAERESLYAQMRVTAGWHEDCAQGEADTDAYRWIVSACA